MSRAIRVVLQLGFTLALVVGAAWTSHWWTVQAITAETALAFPRRVHHEYLQSVVGLRLVGTSEVTGCQEEPAGRSPTRWTIVRRNGGAVLDVDELGSRVARRSWMSDVDRVARVFTSTFPDNRFNARVVYQHIELTDSTEIYIAEMPVGDTHRSHAIVLRMPTGASESR